jgi:hypothetical protein
MLLDSTGGNISITPVFLSIFYTSIRVAESPAGGEAVFYCHLRLIELSLVEVQGSVRLFFSKTNSILVVYHKLERSRGKGKVESSKIERKLFLYMSRWYWVNCNYCYQLAPC